MVRARLEHRADLVEALPRDRARRHHLRSPGKALERPPPRAMRRARGRLWSRPRLGSRRSPTPGRAAARCEPGWDQAAASRQRRRQSRWQRAPGPWKTRQASARMTAVRRGRITSSVRGPSGQVRTTTQSPVHGVCSGSAAIASRTAEPEACPDRSVGRPDRAESPVDPGNPARHAELRVCARRPRARTRPSRGQRES